MHRFFAPDLDPRATSATLPDDEAHHLRHVLRLGTGAGVAVFDGRGGEWTGRVALASKRAVAIDGLRPATPVAEPQVIVTLAVGLLKGEHMDAVVRDATMLGVAAIVPMRTEHVVAPARPGPARAHDRWHRVAVASAKQCGRAVVPQIAPLGAFDSLVSDASFASKVMCVEPARAAGDLTRGAAPASALVLVGPEGGWSPRELALAAGLGVRLIHLGPRTLRAESAPAIALSALWTVWGWS